MVFKDLEFTQDEYTSTFSEYQYCSPDSDNDLFKSKKGDEPSFEDDEFPFKDCELSDYEETKTYWEGNLANDPICESEENESPLDKSHEPDVQDKEEKIEAFDEASQDDEDISKSSQEKGSDDEYGQSIREDKEPQTKSSSDLKKVETPDNHAEDFCDENKHDTKRSDVKNGNKKKLPSKIDSDIIRENIPLQFKRDNQDGFVLHLSLNYEIDEILSECKQYDKNNNVPDIYSDLI